MLRSLPAKPDLNQLRKQAKELLERFRAGDPNAAGEVRRFEPSADRSRFALHDAQRILALSYGFESWSKLKAKVDGSTVTRLAQAVESGDAATARLMLAQRPELAAMDLAPDNEQRALHLAVLRRDVPMVRLLMEAGADARQGVWPHRDATSPYHLAFDRGYQDVLDVIEAEEHHRREEMSCPSATVSPVQDQITAAIREGETETARMLLQEDGTRVQACDREGSSPLHIAAEEGNIELVRWLLERRADARREDLNGMTPLDRAALAADEDFPGLADLLLAHRAPLTLRAAVALGRLAEVRTQVEGNPAVFRNISWRTGGLLTLAVRHGRPDMLRLLLDLGGDPDERTVVEELEEPVASWGSPLWHAAAQGRRDLAELLLDRGADPNANVYASGWPLRNAWNLEDDAVKRLLLERGAVPQPYMLSENHDVDGARRLLESDDSEQVAQELAWSAGDHGCPAILELALPRLIWPRSDSRWHWILIQPIRGAASDRQADFFRCLEMLLARVDPDVTTHLSQTALHFTAGRRGLEGTLRARFAAILLDHGASLTVRDHLLQSTPLAWAIRWGRPELVQLLLSRGAPLDETDAQPWAQPRAWARRMGHDDLLP